MQRKVCFGAFGPDFGITTPFSSAELSDQTRAHTHATTSRRTRFKKPFHLNDLIQVHLSDARFVASDPPTQNTTRRRNANPRDVRIDPADPMRFLVAISNMPNVVSIRLEEPGPKPQTIRRSRLAYARLHCIADDRKCLKQRLFS
ncbi:MAG TPA: hypothetical protein DEQ73_07200 [Phycisphaerales bacterium]|nr:hypothetical protein [Phycisphaerales bacterium]